MVIGNGMIAKAFKTFVDDADNIIFASGVSNSGETNPAAFEREKKLLESILNQVGDGRLIYFSSYSVTHKMSPYTMHKLEMEDMISVLCKRFLIFRPTNVVGLSDNPHILLNYLTQKIRNDEPITVYQFCERNLIDIDDMKCAVNELLFSPKINNQILHIGYPYSYKVSEIVSAIENYYNVVAQKRYSEIMEYLSQPFYDLSGMKSFTSKPRDQYIGYLLTKYFPKSQGNAIEA